MMWIRGLFVVWASLICGTRADAGVWGFHSESAYGTFQEGLQALQEGQLDAARAHFEAAAAKDVESDIPRYGLALVALHSNQPEAADSVLSVMVREHADASLWVSWVKTAIAMEDNERAVARSREAVQQFPDHSEVVQYAVLMAIQSGDITGATQIVKTARSTRPDAVWSCFSLMIAAERGAASEAKEHWTNCGMSTERAFVKAAQNRLELLEPQSVRSMWSKSQEEKDPLEMMFYEIREHIRAGDNEAALAQMNRYVSRYPNNPYVLFLRSDILHRLSRFDEAHKDREKIFTLGRNVDIWDKGQIVGTLTPKMVQVERQNIAAIAIFHTLYSAEGLGFEGAKQAVEKSEVWLGTGPAIEASRAYLRFLEGQENEAWTDVQRLTSQQWNFLSHRAFVLLVEVMVRYTQVSVPETVFAWMDTIGAWHVRYNRASRWHNEGKYRDCSTDLATATSQEPSVQEKFRILAYRCVVAAKDLTGANAQLQSLGGVNRVPATQVLAHGWLLMEHHRAADVPAFVSPLVLEQLKPSERKDLYALKIAALVTSENIEGALAIATGKEPRTEYNLAVLLYNAGRYEEAETVLNRTCSFAEPAFQPDCLKLLSTVKEAE